MGRQLDDMLNECLERLAGGEDIYECVRRYPDHAGELLPLLQSATATVQAAEETRSPEARARGRARLAEALTARGVREKRRRSLLSWIPLARPMAIGLALVAATALAAGWTTVASSDSLPGDALYWVKTTKESVSLRIPRSEMNRAQIHANLAGVRGEELRRLIASGRYGDSDWLLRRINFHLGMSASHAGVTPLASPIETPAVLAGPRLLRAQELRFNLERDGRILRAEWVRLMGDVPSGRRHRVQRFMRQSELEYRMLIDGLLIRSEARRLPFSMLEPSGSGPQ